MGYQSNLCSRNAMPTRLKDMIHNIKFANPMNIKKMMVKMGFALEDAILALPHMYKLLRQGVFINYTPGDWAIGWDDVVVLDDEINRYRQHGNINYLEIGSGFSTVAVAKLLAKKFDKAKIVSLESDLAWIESTRREIHRNLSEHELAKVDIEFKHICYDLFRLGDILEETLSVSLFDIIFVDAPPDITMPNARQKVIELLFNRLAAKSTLIIHDTQRNDEMYAFEVARHKFLSSEFIKTRKGISILRFPKLRAG